MDFKNTFFAIVLVGILVSAVGIIVNDWGVEYGSDITSDFGSYNKIGDVENYITNYSGRISPQSGEASSTAEDITYKGVFGILAGIFQPFRLVYSMIDTLFERFGIPDYIKIGIISMIIASIIFTIIAIIFRLSKSNI